MVYIQHRQFTIPVYIALVQRPRALAAIFLSL
jgi:hypothetical protein